jgi:NTE family protein
MQAYAVMDGGGVKGAALAGCLLAAEEAGIEFVGYGGTSAGSTVALLACVGYSGAELEQIMTTELKLGELLNDVKAPLELLKKLPADLDGLTKWNAVFRLRKYKGVVSELKRDFGLAGCEKFVTALFRLVQKKVGDRLTEAFTFSDLTKLGLPPLKVVASNLSNRQPLVFSAVDEDGPVLSAVRGSMSYPFIFKPLTLGERRFVDGGLCSNLPAFLFDQERAQDKLPLIAFDLVSPSKEPPNPYRITSFVTDLLETALEAGDFLRRQSRDFYRVEIPTPEGIDTLDFNVPLPGLRALVNAGRAETSSFINRELAPWTQAEDEVERLQALFAPNDTVQFVLRQFASDLEQSFGISSVRTAISLPTGHGTRIVAYQYGMDDDPDQSLQLAESAGCSGQCWSGREPTYADLREAAADPFAFGLTSEQQARVRKDRKAMLSVLIFDRMALSDRENPEPPLLGVLSFDTDRSLEDLGWSVEEGNASDSLQQAIATSMSWSGIITKVLR